MLHGTAVTVFEAINASTQGDDELQRQKHDFLLLAIRYARLRTDWRMTFPDERRAMDAPRRLAHNAFIDQCNVLSRIVGKAGRDNGWRNTLGDDRKEIGDFACHLHCILGILAR